MKKITSNILLGLTLLSITLAYNTTNIYAQDATEGIVFGPGIAYGDGVENLGISVDGYYPINDKIRAGVGLTYFFPDKQTIFGTEFTSKFFALDLNANYFFYSKDAISAYGLGGINILFLSVEGGGFSDSDNEMGLNLGIGGEYALDFGDIFAEVKITGIAGDADQLVIGAGVRFGL